MKTSRIALLPLLAALGAAASAQAATPLTHTVATFAQKKDRNGASPRSLTYDNRDTVKVVTTTTRTPIYTAVTSPVYTAVKQPIVNAKGVVTGYKIVQVQTGTTVTQKLTGYSVTTKKAATITPGAKIFTKSGAETYGRPIAATATFNMPTKSKFTGSLGGRQDAILTISAVSSVAPTLAGFTFSQPFTNGSILLQRTVAMRAVAAANGRAYGPSLRELLHVTFASAILTGNTQTNVWSLSGDSTMGAMTMTSSFFATPTVTSLHDFGFTFGGIASALKLPKLDPSWTSVSGAHALSTFQSNVSGSVMSSAVPEPATWAMLILGMGAVGGALRRRSANAGLRFA